MLLIISTLTQMSHLGSFPVFTPTPVPPHPPYRPPYLPLQSHKVVCTTSGFTEMEGEMEVKTLPREFPRHHPPPSPGAPVFCQHRLGSSSLLEAKQIPLILSCRTGQSFLLFLQHLPDPGCLSPPNGLSGISLEFYCQALRIKYRGLKFLSF